jgi:branched-chain amino acid transport system substrate-binding protein
MHLVREFKGRLITAAVFGAISIAGAANAQNADMPGVTATEIKIGNTMPYSGPASAYSIIAKTE